jgi:hypothetical protein
MSAWIVKEKLPAAVGVPSSTPSSRSVNPEGSPTKEAVNTARAEGTVGPVESPTKRESEYATPTLADAASVESIHTVTGAELTTMVKSAEIEDFPALVAWTVNSQEPAVVGVPVRSPVEAASDSPFGTVPALTAKVAGMEATDTSSAYATPTVAVAASVESIHTVGVAGAELTTTSNCSVSAECPGMSASIVKEKLPAPVGVPASPPPAARVNPGGSVPSETVKAAIVEGEAGVADSPTERESEYATPTVAVIGKPASIHTATSSGATVSAKDLVTAA